MLVDRGWEVTSSLAGRVANPKLPAGNVRIGGFGGPAGLTRWLIDNAIEVVVDATHPFAEHISVSAAEAALATRTPLVALHRPAWQPGDGDRWIDVADMQQAAARARRDYHHIFLTIGRQQLAPFAADADNLYVIRCVDPPEVPLPPRHRLILDRGPFDVDGEKRLLKGNQIDCVVTKNSGGKATMPKLQAARSLGIDVIMVARPPLPGGSAVTCVTTARQAMQVLSGL
nr:cobalt-precorrin-6A reductase [Corynebacterium mendelii]